MARFSQDIIRVYNPLYIDFRFLYNGYPNTVKARSYKDMERFRATLYFKKISQYMIGQAQIDKGDELLKKRRDRGLDEILDKYQENRQIWDKTPKLNNPELLKDIAKKVIIGLVEEYGKEEPLPEQRIEPRPEMTALDEEIFAEASKNRVEKELPLEPLREEELQIEITPPKVKPLKKGENE